MKLSFEVGQVLITRNALEYLKARGQELTALHILSRHIRGDWGDLDAHDKALNVEALISGARIFSAYRVHGEKFYVITEAKGENGRREATTVLLASDY